MEKIKLVIWDLDETFWKGTLSEEGIEMIDEHIQIVKTLTDRGIMNSIASKNDFEKAKNTLIKADIWNYFIFPAIEWSPKGSLVKKTIEDCQLRDVNVLFLDDNHMNLEEARYYNPGLHTKEPDFISEILHHPAFKGKDDQSHSRLKQYKILEKKAKEKQDYTSNEEFLRSSEIKIRFIKELEPHKERLHELLNRTNQLNYTKKRLNENEVDQLISDNSTKSLIQVSDKFGDYGIVGFYSLNEAKNSLEHFTFSCRILNLGVVQFVYNCLGSPDLKVIPEVAEDINDMNPDWIDEELTLDINNLNPSRKKPGQQPAIFFKGSCDLEVVLRFLEDRLSANILKEVHYANEKNMVIRSDHTYNLVESHLLDQNLKNEFITHIPFVEGETYSRAMFEKKYEVVVFSVLSDFYQNVYTHKKHPFHITCGNTNKDLTDPKNEKNILQQFSEKKIEGMTSDFLKYFRENFSFSGKISSENFIKNLQFIRKQIDINTPILFINGTEVPPKDPAKDGITERHIQMNIALQSFIDSAENCHLLDIRTVIFSPNHTTTASHNRHFVREKYYELGELIFNKVEELIGKKVINPKPITIQSVLLDFRRFFLKNNLIPRSVHNGWRRIRGRIPLS